MARADHEPTDWSSIEIYVGHDAAIPISRVALDAHLLANHHRPEVIASSLGRQWIRFAATKLRRVEASQPNLFALSGGAGVAVVAARDGDGLG